MSLQEKDNKSSTKIFRGSTTGRHETVEFMGPETVSRRNFWNVYKFKQRSLLKCGREDEILPIFGDC